MAPILKVRSACLSTEGALSIEIRAALSIGKTKKGLSLVKQYSFRFAVAVTYESILIKNALTLIRRSLSDHLILILGHVFGFHTSTSREMEDTIFKARAEFQI